MGARDPVTPETAETFRGRMYGREIASRDGCRTGTMPSVHDWPTRAEGSTPSPTLVAAMLALGVLATERVPLWAAHWLADGRDGAALGELAGLHGDDPHEVRDLLPAALAECDVNVPDTDTATAMELFTHLARLYAAGRASERWIATEVERLMERTGYADGLLELPMGQLAYVADEWAGDWGRVDARLRDVVRQACHDQLRLAADG